MADANARRTATIEGQSPLRYRLARSLVVVEGRVTTRSDPVTLDEHPSATIEVSVRVEADPDPDAAGSLPLDRDFWKSHDLDVELTPDGRLRRLSAGASGTGGAIVSGLIRLGTFAVSLATTAVTRGGEADLEKTYAAKNPEIAKVRREMGEALGDLQLRLASLAKVAADPGCSGDERLGARRELRALRAATAAVRAEVDELDTHFRAWVANRSATREETWSAAFATTALPERERAEPRATFTIAELARDLKEVADRLGVVPVRIADRQDPPSGSRDGGGGQDDRAVSIRLPRTCTLAVYALDASPDDASDEVARTGRLQSVRTLWVLDERSTVVTLPLDSGLFSKQTALVEFAETGALTRVASSATAGVQGVSDALAVASETATKSAEQVQSLSAALAELRDRGAEQRLADLQREKATVEVEIAAKGLLSGRADRERLESLQAQLDIAKANRALGTEAAGAEIDASLRELRHRLEIAKIGAELAKFTEPGPRP